MENERGGWSEKEKLERHRNKKRQIFFPVWFSIRGTRGDKTKRTVTQRNNPCSVPSCSCCSSLLPLSPISTDSCWDSRCSQGQFADIIRYILSVQHSRYPAPQHFYDRMDTHKKTLTDTQRDDDFRHVQFSMTINQLQYGLSLLQFSCHFHFVFFIFNKRPSHG